MAELTTVLTYLYPLLSSPQYRQLSLVTQTLLEMTGRITMLSISRWAGKGGSYRTIQRFFMSRLPWAELNWAILKRSLSNHGVILIAGDVSVVTKSGQETHGLSRFFSSIHSRVIPSIAFQTLSIIDVEQHRSWPLLVEQLLPKVTRKKTETPSEKTARSRGRPKGSKNKNRRDVKLNAEMTQVKAMLKQLLTLTAGTRQLTYFVYDGAFGNNAAVQMTRQTGLHLISKLRNDAALFFKYDGRYSGKGRPRLYGQRIDYDHLPETALKSDNREQQIRTRIYQFEGIHKRFADPLNVVVILKENTKTGKQARVVLFSSDDQLEWEKLIDYYRLRFQIEFNFRDAKQHWGLEDFMVIKERAVFNAANVSLFMVNVSQAMLSTSTEQSILDLKARFHGIRYAREVFKILPDHAKTINIIPLLDKIPILGRIHEEKWAA